MNDYMDMFTEWTEGQILAADSTLGGERRVIFYQIVERTPQTVKVRKIRAKTTETAAGFTTSPPPVILQMNGSLGERCKLRGISV